MGIAGIGRVAAGATLGLAAGASMSGLTHLADTNGTRPQIGMPSALGMIALALGTPAFIFSQAMADSSKLGPGGALAMMLGTAAGAGYVAHRVGALEGVFG